MYGGVEGIDAAPAERQPSVRYLYDTSKRSDECLLRSRRFLAQCDATTARPSPIGGRARRRPAGNPSDAEPTGPEPENDPGLADWYVLVRRHTTAGRPMTRIRIVDEPLTDYQRRLIRLDRWNIEAGEVTDHPDRAVGVEVGRAFARSGAGPWLW
ncbi:DUF6879 family protein [Actinoplanes couchii]